MSFCSRVISFHGIHSGLRLGFRQEPPSEEYRARLIAEVVTGKRDVREAAANLSEAPEAGEPELVAGAVEVSDD